MKRWIMLFSVVALVLSLSVFAPAARAAGFIIGLPAYTNNGNSFPFGSAYSGEYQQVYTSSAFSGPVKITNIEFFNTAYNSGATAMNSGNWAISLSTTSADWNTLSGTYASNIGTNNTLVFSGNLAQPWAFGQTLVINLSTPFTYNPGNGSLLMDVYATNTSAPGGDLFFDANGNDIMSRVYGGSLYGSVNPGYGLVTGFNAAPVPIPGAFLLLGPGLVGLGAIRRRLKK